MWKLIPIIKNGILIQKWEFIESKNSNDMTDKYVRCLGFVANDYKKGDELQVMQEFDKHYDLVETVHKVKHHYLHQPKNIFSEPYTKDISTMIQTKEAEVAIKEESKSKSSIYNGPYTKTALFLLPMLGLSLRNLIFKKYLYNAYLEDVEYEHDYMRPIFILLKVKDFTEKSYKDLVEVLKSFPEFKIDYDLGKQEEDNLVMFVFETKEEWAEDYYHFKAGRYSKFSSKYRLKFTRDTVGADNKSIESLMWGVIYKSTYRKDQVALHFSVKKTNENGKQVVADMSAYKQLREEIDTWEEIYDKAHREEEYYRFKS